MDGFVDHLHFSIDELLQHVHEDDVGYGKEQQYTYYRYPPVGIAGIPAYKQGQ
jgi:hypothetical protein